MVFKKKGNSKILSINTIPVQIDNMNLKIIEIQSKFKKPTLKRVKISAEAMLRVLLGSKHKESIDFKANLKTVKKEEEKVNRAFASAPQKPSARGYFWLKWRA